MPQSAFDPTPGDIRRLHEGRVGVGPLAVTREQALVAACLLISGLPAEAGDARRLLRFILAAPDVSAGAGTPPA